MNGKTALRILIIAALLALVLFIGLVLGSSAAEAQRTVTISVPSGARVEIYAEAGHTSSEVRWKCVGGKYRAAADSFRPSCRRIVLTSKIWFDYAVIRSQQKEARYELGRIVPGRSVQLFG